MLWNLGIGFILGFLVAAWVFSKKAREILRKIWSLRLRKKEAPLVVPVPKIRKPRAKKVATTVLPTETPKPGE
jgi:hypothetical protein